MNRLCISTRGIRSWQDRLANPKRQWRRGFSAFEAAVAWEYASRSESGIPLSIRNLFCESTFGSVTLLLGVVEHKEPLLGGNAASQCDVWAIINTSAGMLSLSVEAKAQEPFGDETLELWLRSGKSDRSKKNREKRWGFISARLPKLISAQHLRYQMLHRCAAAIIEAQRLGLRHAAFVVQAFNAPDQSFQDYLRFCQAMDLVAERGRMATTAVDTITLHIGWADCPLASDKQVAATV